MRWNITVKFDATGVREAAIRAPGETCHEDEDDAAPELLVIARDARRFLSQLPDRHRIVAGFTFVGGGDAVLDQTIPLQVETDADPGDR